MNAKNLNEKTIFESAMIATQKRSNKINTDLFNSHKETSAHGAKINLNRLFKVEHYGLNSVLKTLTGLYGKHAFNSYNKALLNQKGFKIEKADLTFKSVKELFPAATFFVDKETQRTYICRFKKINSAEDASVLVGQFTGLNGKSFNFKTPQPYFEVLETETKDGTVEQMFTIVPRESFTGWQILSLIVKYKELAATKETETETETETDK